VLEDEYERIPYKSKLFTVLINSTQRKLASQSGLNRYSFVAVFTAFRISSIRKKKDKLNQNIL
jgi:hypothetical protein